MRAAHAILAGELPESAPAGGAGDFYFIEADSPATIAERIKALVRERIPQRFGLDGLRDVQVLTPMHKSDLGAQALNATLQRVLNPSAGAQVERVNLRDAGGEPVADLIARPSAALRGTDVSAAEVPTLVDEVPILAVLASRAAGETTFREVGELRVKESNRLELIAANLRAVGVDAQARGNDLHVQGTTRPPRGRVETARDHRLAMAFAVLGTVPGADIRLSENRSVAISYPRFFADLRRIRATGNVERVT